MTVTAAACFAISLLLAHNLLLLPRQALSPAAERQERSAQVEQKQPGAPAETIDSLRSRIAGHIGQFPLDRARWGIKIISLDTGKTVFEHDNNRFFTPASNAKLFTAALVLDQLGPDYKIRTSLYAAARPDSAGVIKGDLTIYGRGDPMMAARLNDGDYYKALEPLATALYNSGVRRVEGDLIGDDSCFEGAPLGSGWEWDNLQWYYGAEVSALSVNDNSVDLSVRPAERIGLPCKISIGPATGLVTIMNRTQTAEKGSPCRIAVYRPIGENIIYVSGCVAAESEGYAGSIAVHNPAAFFAALFKEVLERRGIAVKGRSRSVDWNYRAVVPLDFGKQIELAYVESPPLKEMIRETLKPSQNLYAQLLLLQAGVAWQRAQTERNNKDRVESQTTEEAAISSLRAFLTEIGITDNSVMIEEGSGLSRRNLVTPDAIVSLLKFMSRHRWADFYRAALPVAGYDGTLKGRMKDTAATGNVRAKTGTLRFVHTLSGYATTASGERLAFSIMVNDAGASDRGMSFRDQVDGLAVMLSGFTGRT